MKTTRPVSVVFLCFFILITTSITSRAAGILTVSGTGQDLFSVHDAANTQVGLSRTNGQVEVEAGTYTVRLNNTVRAATVRDDATTELVAGALNVTGTGQDIYSVYGADNNRLDLTSTNTHTELFVGTYTVRLNNTVRTARVEARQITILPAGRVNVAGTGQDLYSVYDANNNRLDLSRTNSHIELFAGIYTVRLNNTVRTVNIEEGQPTVLTAGFVLATGSGDGLYSVFDLDYNRLDLSSIGAHIELFPGEYLLTSSGIYQPITVHEGSNQFELGPPPPPERKLPTLHLNDQCTELGLLLTNADVETGEKQGTEEIWALFGDKNTQGQLVNIKKVLFVSSSDPFDKMQVSFGSNFLPSQLEYSNGTTVAITGYDQAGSEITAIRTTITSGNGSSVPRTIAVSGQNARRLFQVQQTLREYTNFVQDQDIPDPTSFEEAIRGKMTSDQFLKTTETMAMAVFSVRDVMSCAFGTAFACNPSAMGILSDIRAAISNQYESLRNLAPSRSTCALGVGLEDFDNSFPGGGGGGIGEILDFFNDAGSLSPVHIIPPKGVSNGDPHLFTYDDLAYDFQAVGEFVYTKSTQPTDTFEIQVRQRARLDSTKIALTSAVAMNVGSDRVGLYPASIYINGAVQEIPEGETTLSGGGTINRDGKDFTITWPSFSAMVKVNITSHYGMLVQAYISPSLKGQLIGLMGNADGNPDNDLATSDGTGLGSNPSFRQLYPGFADSWRVSGESSLFDYAQGESTATFTKRGFPSEPARIFDLPLSTRRQAEKICRHAGITNQVVLDNCILDVGLTGESGYASLPSELANSETKFKTGGSSMGLFMPAILKANKSK